MGVEARDEGVVDPEAFCALVDRSGPDVYAYLARRAPADAEDLLARVWVEAFAARRTFDPARGSARSWLFGVARNVLLRHWRDRRSAPPNTALATITWDPWDDVDARLDSTALAGPLRAAMGALPDADREVLLLVAWEQLTPTQAAAVLGIPAATARSRLHRARARMRAALDVTGAHGVDHEHDATGQQPPMLTRPTPGGPR